MSTDDQTPAFDDLLSQADAARVRGVTRQAISKLVAKGRLKGYEVAGREFVRRTELDALDERTVLDEMDAPDHLDREVQDVIANLSAEQRKAWFTELRKHVTLHPLEEKLGVRAEVILAAIARASDLTLRGVRGIIAEEAFRNHVLEPLAESGWAIEQLTGDHAFDFAVSRTGRRATIQVKLQRQKAQQPMEAQAAYRAFDADFWVVETQKTRGGDDGKGGNTRPYHRGEFDILAVSMQPSAKRWDAFRYTLDRWLIADPGASDCLLKFQPVPKRADNAAWTDDLAVALQWLAEATDARTIPGLSDPTKLQPGRTRRANKSRG